MLTRFTLLVSLSVVGCFAQPAPKASLPPAAPLTRAELDSLHRKRDYFTLRDRLEATGDVTSVTSLVARVFVASAFNQPDSSNHYGALALSRSGLNDSTRVIVRRHMVMNHLRAGDYERGAQLADSLVSEKHPALSPADQEDIANVGLIMKALAGVPPQEVRRAGGVKTTLNEGRIPVLIGDSARSYIFDTGANLSTIMRSEAAALKLDVRAAGIRVGTSTDAVVTADIGIAERVRLGGIEFRNVVFLVLPDELLTFGPMRIPGIIGFPVISELGEVRIGSRGELEVPAEVPERMQRNLALSGLTPLTMVRWRGRKLICRLDTGADKTDFYAPFLQRFRQEIETQGERADRSKGGAGGIRQLPVFEMKGFELSVGDTIARLERTDVLLNSIVQNADDDYLDCNIGHDVLDQFSEYVMNFRDMSFLLR